MAEVAVVGGGVIGLACARALAARGADVLLLEASTVGAGASWGNAGWIVPSLSAPLPAPGLVGSTVASMLRPGSPVYVAPRTAPRLLPWLWQFWRHCDAATHAAGLEATATFGASTMDQYDDLAAAGVDPAMRYDGLLFVFRERDAALDARDSLAPLTAYGYPTPVLLEGADLHHIEPSLADDVVAGFLVAGERHLDPALFVASLTRHVRALGVEVREGVEVTGFDARAGRVSALRTGRGRIDAGHVILAAGAWTAPLARRLGVRLPIEPGKGYSFSIHPEPRPSRPLYLYEASVGCTPLGDGVRVAGTMEFSGRNARIDERRIRAIARGAHPYLRGWDGTTITDAWTGMRPVTPDGLPVLGPLPGYTNVTVASGHAMLGVTLAPTTGAAMADLILDGRRDPIRPFDPSRFVRGRRRTR